MISVRIPIALERRILESSTSEPLVNEVRELLIKARAALEVKERGMVPGLGFKRIVEVLRGEMGDRLLLPPKITSPFTVRVILRVKELGFDEQQLVELARCGLRDWMGGIEISTLLRHALRLLAGEFRQSREVSESNREVGEDNSREPRVDSPASVIYTGR